MNKIGVMHRVIHSFCGKDLGFAYGAFFYVLCKAPLKVISLAQWSPVAVQAECRNPLI